MNGRIRPSAVGRRAAALAALSLYAALASGNNLLYLVYGLLTAAFAVSWLWLRASTGGLRASADLPEALRAGGRFMLGLRVRNAGTRPVHGLRAVLGAASAELPDMGPGEEGRAALEACLPHRGRNALEGLRLETSFPFALLTWRAGVPAEGTALPRPADGLTYEEVEAVCESSGTLRPKRGGGDDLYGVRPYAAGDEVRLINWKLTLRSRGTIVNEFSDPAGTKVTVRVDDARGEEGERRAAAAAAALEACCAREASFRFESRGEATGYGTGRGHLGTCLERLALVGDGAQARTVPAPPGAPDDLPAEGAALDSGLLAGSLLVCAGLFIVDDMEPRLLLAALPAFPLSWAMSAGLLRRPPEWVWTPLSLGVLAGAFLFDVRASGIMMANTHLLLYMLVNRLLVRPTPPDRRQAFTIHFLAFFLVSGQTISPWYFLFLLAYAAYAALWLARARAVGPAAAPWRAAALPLAAALALTGVLFAATPRIEPLRQTNPFIKLGLDKRKPSARSAVQFSERVSLGFYGSLRRSSARVMRVKPLQAGGGDAPPAPFLLVRGPAFDRFDGRSWSKERAPFTFLSGRRQRRARDGRGWAERRGRLLEFPGAGSEAGMGYEVSLYPLNSAVVFSVGGLSRMEEPDASVWFDPTDSAYFGAPVLQGETYRVWGDLFPGRGLGPSIVGYDELLRTRFLDLSGGSPRIAELARALTKGRARARDKMTAVRDYLRKGYEYSLYSDDASRDLEDFLLRSRSGNCEYFATAAVMLLRHAGVPARLAAGFFADSWNEFGGFYDVRQGQAHAWAEAWDGEGWVVVDGVPPGGSDVRTSALLLGRFKRWATAAQLRWYRDVIGYDSFIQRDALRRARMAVARERLSQSLDSLVPALKAVGAAALVLGAALAAAPRLRRRPKRRFEKAQRLLETAGLPRRPEQTPREFAEAVARLRPELEAARELAELHYRELYAPAGLAPEEARRGDELLRELGSAARRTRSRV